MCIKGVAGNDWQCYVEGRVERVKRNREKEEQV